MPFRCSLTVGTVTLKQLRDQRLRQPERLVLEPALDARAAVLGLVEDDAGLRRRVVGHGFRS